MVARTLVAFDSEDLVVQSSSSAGLVGNPIINNSDTPNGTVFTFSSTGGQNVTLDDTGGDPDTFEDDQSGSHTITDGAGIVANGTGVEAESTISVRALDGGGNPVGPVINITVFSQNGVTGDVWGFSTDIPLTDGLSYVKVAGSNIGSASYTTFVTCFGPDTMIATAAGSMPIGDIALNDMIWTSGNGLQPVRWIGRTTVPGTGAFAPVVIAAGALGNARPLTVSQEHRMYFSDGLAQYLFGTQDILIAAKHLCALPGVSIVPRAAIQYTHFMFDTHQIVSANGALSESFFLSETSLSGLETGPRTELLTLFPSLANPARQYGATAATTLKHHEASLWCHYAAAA